MIPSFILYLKQINNDLICEKHHKYMFLLLYILLTITTNRETRKKKLSNCLSKYFWLSLDCQTRDGHQVTLTVYHYFWPKTTSFTHTKHRFYHQWQYFLNTKLTPFLTHVAPIHWTLNQTLFHISLHR